MRDQSLSVKQPRASAAPAAGTARSRGHGRRAVGRAAGHIVLIAGAIVMLVLLLWMVSTALKRTGQEWVFPPVWIPNPVWWRNYPEAMAVLPVPFYRYVLNTLIIILGATVGTVCSASLAAFAFARLR